MDILNVLYREFVYISYYFLIQFHQIVKYWIVGMVVGSLISVFAKDAIHNCFERIRDKKWGVWGVIPASILGIASPLCMYGTIPIAASFSRHGMRHDWLAAFMMSSVLLNPQLLMYSGMSMGSAAAFMITGPATKITNLGALKIVLGIKRFILYILFVMVFSFVTGIMVNLLVV